MYSCKYLLIRRFTDKLSVRDGKMTTYSSSLLVVKSKVSVGGGRGSVSVSQWDHRTWELYYGALTADTVRMRRSALHTGRYMGLCGPGWLTEVLTVAPCSPAITGNGPLLLLKII